MGVPRTKYIFFLISTILWFFSAFLLRFWSISYFSENKSPWNIIFFLLLDNDKPTISTSNPTPVENSGTVPTLRCNPATTDSIYGYEWYKDGRKIEDTALDTYDLPGNDRANSGSYKCKVVSDNAGTSQLSDDQTVTFLCKFDKLFLTYVALVDDRIE